MFETAMKYKLTEEVRKFLRTQVSPRTNAIDLTKHRALESALKKFRGSSDVELTEDERRELSRFLEGLSFEFGSANDGLRREIIRRLGGAQ